MSLQLKIDGQPVSIDLRRFPAGETFLRLPENQGHHASPQVASVTLAFDGNDDLLNLALLVDALRRRYCSKLRIVLVMPYLPYARQDRVCAEGESLSLKVVCDFINNLNLAEVICWNIHSDVGVYGLNNLTHIGVVGVCWRLPFYADPATTILVSPDAGASKKVFAVAKQYGYNDVVRADKTRDVASGKITGTVVFSEHVGDKDFLIVDDLCDAGGTFMALAVELRKLTTGRVMLYVTHGLFTAGVDKFHGVLDKIYVSNMMMRKEFVDTNGIVEML